MKPLPFVPPVIAMAGGAAILLLQRNSISSIEEESLLLRTRIASARANPAGQPDAPAISPAIRETGEKEPIDWKGIAESLGDMGRTGGMKGMRKMMSFQRKLLAMDKNGLVAALETIAALELDDTQRLMLENIIIGPLVMKDPELALTRFSTRLGNERDGMSWQLANALGQWAGKDAAAATAWFDREIAAGTFDSKSLDGKSRVRTGFESNLVSQLLKTDMAAAAARVGALPADQRKDVFNGFGFQQLKEEEQAAFAGLVRSQLPEADRLGVFADQASTIAMKGGLEKAAQYLDRIGATPQERMRGAESAARSSIEGKAYQSRITAEGLDSMREWLGAQSPESVERITGESLGVVSRSGGITKFAETVQLVMGYHDAGGGDDLLVGFLGRAQVGQNKEEARRVAEKISDPEKREKALERLK